MMAIGFMRRIWRYIVEILNVWGCIVFGLPLLVIYAILAVMMVVEITLFDPLYIAADVIDGRLKNGNWKHGVEKAVWYLTRV